MNTILLLDNLEKNFQELRDSIEQEVPTLQTVSDAIIFEQNDCPDCYIETLNSSCNRLEQSSKLNFGSAILRINALRQKLLSAKEA
jgi:hypothetical protein